MIRTFSPFPFITQTSEISGGFLYKESSICANCTAKECANIGFKEKTDQIRRCFKGYNFTYARDFSDVDLVWIAFLLNGERFPDNYKLLQQEGFKVDKSAIDRVRTLFGPDGEVRKSTVNNQKRGESRALHDLKHLVTALTRVIEGPPTRASNVEGSYASQEDIGIMRHAIWSSYNILGAIKDQIEMSDYILAPDSTEKLKEREIDIYPLFDKSVRIYNTLAIQQKKFIEIRTTTGFIRGKRLLKEHFVLLPAILLQNAIKYSIEGSSTLVEVADFNRKIRVTVKSTGPIIPSADRERIWKLGEQYINPNDTAKGGSGYGLYLAKSICQDTGFSISYDGEFIEMRNGVPIALNSFVVQEK